ncbi:alpha/beta fold hydrolase [Streptomyces hyaluromycini]|uniref:alpha/beta fold hydrolase n=1 Tax=Streptomyces hyaluromycini TaxID=1377993 RepID=UPI000B5C6641|nr:hypothetical protein [Streptomyces hyaluromycini]
MLADHLLPLIPTATLTVLKDTGHLSPLKVPDQVAAHINAFLAQLSAQHSNRTSLCRSAPDRGPKEGDTS